MPFLVYPRNPLRLWEADGRTELEAPSGPGRIGISDQLYTCCQAERESPVQEHASEQDLPQHASWCLILITRLPPPTFDSTVADCLLQVEARQESGGLEPSAQRSKEWIPGAVLGARVRSRSSSCREGQGDCLSTFCSAATKHPPHSLSPALPICRKVALQYT